MFVELLRLRKCQAAPGGHPRCGPRDSPDLADFHLLDLQVCIGPVPLYFWRAG